MSPLNVRYDRKQIVQPEQKPEFRLQFAGTKFQFLYYERSEIIMFKFRWGSKELKLGGTQIPVLGRGPLMMSFPSLLGGPSSAQAGIGLYLVFCRFYFCRFCWIVLVGLIYLFRFD